MKILVIKKSGIRKGCSCVSDRENRSIGISDSEYNNIIIIKIDDTRVNIRNFLNNRWYRLYKYLLGGKDADIIDINYNIVSDVYSKPPFLKLCPRASTRQGLLFRETSASEGEDHNFFQINKNYLLKPRSYNLESNQAAFKHLSYQYYDHMTMKYNTTITFRNCEKQINEYIFIFLLSGTLVLDKLQLQYNNGE
ncbi:hypothetical protein H8356DRAFT_1349877 [Neocallimastix lanati (nom. inval.)]|nr:hypothetical protein H8356DRAFT_1349877 [Neocallimastix sp. JGI-2020a]